MEAITHIKGHFDYRGSEKIAAIKWYRDWAAQNGLNSGLAECKNFVESLA
jgi:ribosomal protein L7/L12